MMLAVPNHQDTDCFAVCCILEQYAASATFQMIDLKSAMYNATGADTIFCKILCSLLANREPEGSYVGRRQRRRLVGHMGIAKDLKSEADQKIPHRLLLFQALYPFLGNPLIFWGAGGYGLERENVGVNAHTCTAPTTGMSNSKGISVVLSRPFKEISDTPTVQVKTLFTR